jgi:protoporphyrinogen oxidase
VKPKVTERSESSPKPIVVIGAGLAGLTAAYTLARAGQRVTVLEAAADYGGLAASHPLEGQAVEQFYHFICRSDHHLVKLLADLGLTDQLHWRHTRTAFYHNGRHYAFGTPVDLLRFRPVPWLQRLRFGLHILRSYYRRNWNRLDDIPAKAWLIENIGQEAYQVIWHPLLHVKFADHYDKISAAWMWHRIWRVAQSRRWLLDREMFGWLEQGSATLVDGLVSALRASPTVTLQANTPVRGLQVNAGRITRVETDAGPLACDAVISTVALPILDQWLPRPTPAYFERARQINSIGVVCLRLNLRQPFTSNFWLNINDPHISFNGVIELTNLNARLRAAGLNIIYIPYYLDTREPRYSAPDSALYAEYLPMLKQLNPAFETASIKEGQVFRYPYAQPIFTTGFARQVPGLRTPLAGLYVTDSSQFYPEDRTLSAAIQQGRQAAKFVAADLTPDTL